MEKENPVPGSAGSRAGIDTEQQVVPDTTPQVPAQILPVTLAFDYSALAPEIAEEAKSAAQSIKNRMRWAIEQVGAKLARVQKLLPYGQWGAWLKAEFGMTQRTAQNYIGAANLIGSCEKISKLQSTTLYLLAAPSTPEPVRQEITDRFNAGEVIDDRTVKKMVDEAKFQAQQEQRRAEEAAREAKVSPRTRRNRAQRKAEREQEQREWETKREASRTAAQAAARIIIGAVGDRAAELADLINSFDLHGGAYLINELRAGLGSDR